MWLGARGEDWGVTPQIERPRCGSEPLAAQGKGWLKPAGCRRVDWLIHFDVAHGAAADPSRQRSLFFANRSWWLVSEGSSLLRPLEDRQARIGANIPIVGGGEPVKNTWPLPDSGAPPAFFALGNVARTTVGARGIRVTHVADRPEAAWRAGLIAQQRRTMAWLAEVMRIDDKGRLLVIWLGMDDLQGQISGAAGDRSFVAGYRSRNDRDIALSLMTLAHEQFHQMAALLEKNDHPAWYDESLAQFYALRALSRLGERQRAIRAVRDQFIDAGRPVPVGLLAWQRRYKQGDPAAYPEFYSQGATFWHQLDALLRQATAGRHGLDADLPALLASPTDADKPLPAALLQKWRALAGPAVDQVIRRYLGDGYRYAADLAGCGAFP
jgi:hypothetical protein